MYNKYLVLLVIPSLMLLTIPREAKAEKTLANTGLSPTNFHTKNTDVLDNKRERKRPRHLLNHRTTETTDRPQQSVAIDSNLVSSMLNIHNQYRSELSIAPVVWSDTLASHAQQWANYLASNQKFEHSQGTGEGENLWMGTSGYFSYNQMAEGWASEKKYFSYGTFPNVSTTGNWFDVGHYTQMIWRNTTEIGCAVATGGGNDILVCRYNPPGNYQDQTPY